MSNITTILISEIAKDAILDTINDNFTALNSTKAEKHTWKTTAPTVNDDVDWSYFVWDLWIDETNDKAYICLDNTDWAAVWTEITQAWWGGWLTDFQIEIPIDLTSDTSNHIWRTLLNRTWWDLTATSVDLRLDKNAQWTTPDVSVQLYISSWTLADWIDTSAVNMFTSALSMGWNYESNWNVPDTAVIWNWKYLSARITNVSWSTQLPVWLTIVVKF